MPTIIAAINAANRLSILLGTKVGYVVGYATSKKSKMNYYTNISFVTTGMAQLILEQDCSKLSGIIFVSFFLQIINNRPLFNIFYI